MMEMVVGGAAPARTIYVPTRRYWLWARKGTSFRRYHSTTWLGMFISMQAVCLGSERRHLCSNRRSPFGADTLQHHYIIGSCLDGIFSWKNRKSNNSLSSSSKTSIVLLPPLNMSYQQQKLQQLPKLLYRHCTYWQVPVTKSFVVRWSYRWATTWHLKKKLFRGWNLVRSLTNGWRLGARLIWLLLSEEGYTKMLRLCTKQSWAKRGPRQHWKSPYTTNVMQAFLDWYIMQGLIHLIQSSLPSSSMLPSLSVSSIEDSSPFPWLLLLFEAPVFPEERRIGPLGVRDGDVFQLTKNIQNCYPTIFLTLLVERFFVYNFPTSRLML